MTQDVQLSKKIKEIQILEQTLQSMLMQKQQLQMELSEVSSALSEVSKSSGDVFKVLGGIMLKSDKSIVLKELEEKQKVLNMKVQSFEKQENTVEARVTVLQKEIAASAKVNN